MNGFERRTERKKADIRQAAIRLFSEQGIRKVSIAEIAAEAKVSQVSIYNYFGSKKALVRDVFAVFMEEQWQDFERLLGSPMPFLEKIRRLIFGKTEVAMRLNMEFIRSANDPVVQGYIETYSNEKMLPMLIRLIEQGQREGKVNPGISAEAILLYIRMFRESASRPDMLTEANREMWTDLISLFFYGLIGKPVDL